MKLIENNYGKVRCKTCDSVIIPDRKDICSNYDNECYVVCPVCGQDIWFDGNPDTNPVLKHIIHGGLPHR